MDLGWRYVGVGSVSWFHFHTAIAFLYGILVSRHLDDVGAPRTLPIPPVAACGVDAAASVTARMFLNVNRPCVGSFEAMSAIIIRSSSDIPAARPADRTNCGIGESLERDDAYVPDQSWNTLSPSRERH